MNNDFFTHFTKYQAVYVLATSLIISWTLLGSRIDAVERTIIRHEVVMEKNTENNNDILNRLASIETTLEFIKQHLD